MDCKSIQVDAVIVSGRIGKCTDDDGNSYVDIGGSVGPGLGAYYFAGREEDRMGWDVEARVNLALIGGGQASTISSHFGWGVGAGAGVGIRGLVPTSLGALKALRER